MAQCKAWTESAVKGLNWSKIWGERSPAPSSPYRPLLCLLFFLTGAHFRCSWCKCTQRKSFGR